MAKLTALPSKVQVVTVRRGRKPSKAMDSLSADMKGFKIDSEVILNIPGLTRQHLYTYLETAGFPVVNRENGASATHKLHFNSTNDPAIFVVKVTKRAAK